MSNLLRTTLIAAAVILLLQACGTQGTNLAQQWKAACEAEGHGSRTTGLAACIAKRRANYEAESLSVPANL